MAPHSAGPSYKAFELGGCQAASRVTLALHGTDTTYIDRRPSIASIIRSNATSNAASQLAIRSRPARFAALAPSSSVRIPLGPIRATTTRAGRFWLGFTSTRTAGAVENASEIHNIIYTSFVTDPWLARPSNSLRSLVLSTQPSSLHTHPWVLLGMNENQRCRGGEGK